MEMDSGWIYLIIAGLCEGIFAFFLKLSDNFRNFVPSVLFFIFYMFSAYLLSKAVQQLPIGTAYAVWTGIGAFLTVIIGIIIFNEPTSFLRIFFLATLIVSIIGLNIV